MAIGTMAAKLYAAILEQRISDWAEASNFTAAGQFGFRRQRITAQAALVLRALQDQHRQLALLQPYCQQRGLTVDIATTKVMLAQRAADPARGTAGSKGSGPHLRRPSAGGSHQLQVPRHRLPLQHLPGGCSSTPQGTASVPGNAQLPGPLRRAGHRGSAHPAAALWHHGGLGAVSWR